MKTVELRNNLQNALLKMAEAMSFPEDDPYVESTIQRFEYTFELSWKLISSILKDQGLETYGVKNIIREGARLGLIDNTDLWFEFANARNLSSHIYNQPIAQKVYQVAKSNFIAEVEKLIQSTEKYV